MYLDVVLKPCPWCKETPEIYMPVSEDTWCWDIRCRHKSCDMRPTSPHVSLRNSTKTDYMRFFFRIQDLADRWNRGNPCKPIALKRIELAQVATLTDNLTIATCSDFNRIEAV